MRARARLNDEPRSAASSAASTAGGRLCRELGAPGYDPFGPDGANFNLLIGSEARDPVSGTASHRAYLCEVRRVE